MIDVVAGKPTTIDFTALDRRTGESMTGARISIRKQSDQTWWDGAQWVGSLAYNYMEHIVAGAHEYIMTYPAAGEYKIIFTHDTDYMVRNSYTQTVYPEERLVEADIDGVMRGRGADEGSITIRDEVTQVPVADADVWVTSNLAGTAVVAGTKQTDSEGQVTFWLDTGNTYYIWCQKDGNQFNNPTTVVW
jgi:hypothetical protein